MTLPIGMVPQMTPEWCWLASAQMILQFYEVPAVNGSYQCGIMGAVEGPSSVCFQNCGACVFGSGSDVESAAVLSQYTSIVQQYYYPTERIPRVSGLLTGSAISFQTVEAQIASGHPIEMQITVGGPFMGMAGHDVVLIGYDTAGPGGPTLIINDPFPYMAAGYPDPYASIPGTIQTGPLQYAVPYAAAIQGLQWSDTVLTAAN
jgi:hypothetical protein